MRSDSGSQPERTMVARTIIWTCYTGQEMLIRCTGPYATCKDQSYIFNKLVVRLSREMPSLVVLDTQQVSAGCRRWKQTQIILFVVCLINTSVVHNRHQDEQTWTQMGINSLLYIEDVTTGFREPANTVRKYQIWPTDQVTAQIHNPDSLRWGNKMPLLYLFKENLL
jgi:hypothetical protein